jgi:ribosomal silencing factor RsfS
MLLSKEEIIEGLLKLGGLDVRTVDLNGQIDELETFIFVTGTSTRHLQKMSDVFVKAVRLEIQCPSYPNTSSS